MRVQGLVYIFIALASLGVAAAAYFGFTFTPIEALVTGLSFGVIAVLVTERQLRQRSEARFERAIEDLARLLSTDAKAGQMLSQRINQLADTNAGNRLDGIEADISVLGTVVRQVAEAVAEMEETQRRAARAAGPADEPVAPAPPPVADPEDDDALPGPLIPIDLLRAALAEDRLVCHIEPIIVLPQRRPHAYDIVPRLALEDGDIVDPPDFMPAVGRADDVVRAIEAQALEEAVTIIRRARMGGEPLELCVPLSRRTMDDPPSVTRLLATLEANRAIADSLLFAIYQSEWKQMMPTEKIGMAQMNRLGVGFSLLDANSLRVDFNELESVGFRSVRIDATRFLRNPELFTDFHTADVAPYVRRFHIDVIATGVLDESQLLSLFEDGIGFAQGPHIARPGPVRQDLVGEREAPLRRA